MEKGAEEGGDANADGAEDDDGVYELEALQAAEGEGDEEKEEW